MDATRDKNIDLEATELRLGLPGTSSEKQIPVRSNKRPSDESTERSPSNGRDADDRFGCLAPPPPPSKAQIVGWPPIRSYRKNSLQHKRGDAETVSGTYVKVSVDGAPYLRKIDLNVYSGYQQLLKALENMFKLTVGEYSEREGYKGPPYAPTYEDKDGDWMLVGDVPWQMFTSSCKRLRIMRGSEVYKEVGETQNEIMRSIMVESLMSPSRLHRPSNRGG